MAIKNMQINVPIYQFDSKRRVKDVIFAVMELAGDNFFNIDSVTIDGKEVFNKDTGFANDFSRR